MSINRRTVLKTFLLSPFCAIGPKLRATPMSAPSVRGTLNILLNGLFFMELDNSDTTNPKLVIHAPKLTDHDFIVGTRNNLQLSTGFDWSTGFGLIGGSVTFNGSDIPEQVPTSVLQFTKKEAGLGAFKADNSGVYVGRVALPWPKKKMVSLRPDIFPAFDPGTPQKPTNVASKIIKRCGTSQIGNVVCVEYDCDFSGPVLPPTAPVMNVHLYMRCCKDNDGTVNHINAALKEVAGVFQQDPSHSGLFDLQMQNVHVVESPFEPQPQLPGVPLEEERAAIEDGACMGMPALAARGQNHGTVGVENVSPANCPALFVG